MFVTEVMARVNPKMDAARLEGAQIQKVEAEFKAGTYIVCANYAIIICVFLVTVQKYEENSALLRKFCATDLHAPVPSSPLLGITRCIKEAVPQFPEVEA